MQRVRQGTGSAVDPQKIAACFLLPIVVSTDNNNDKISQEFYSITVVLMFLFNQPQEDQERFQLRPTTSH